MTFQKMTSDPVRDADRHMNERELAADEADEAAHQRWHELWLKLQTRDGVADDYQIRIVREIRFAVAGENFDFLIRQKSGHRRINPLVRAGDAKAALLHGDSG